MLFNSYIFILLFLPLTLILYFSLHHFHLHKSARLGLLVMSLFFYGYFNPYYVMIILCSIIFNYGFAFFMIRKPQFKKGLLCIAVFLNLFVLFYFKYYDFFIDNINTVFSQQFVLHHIILPLGISFFTFQQLSYLVDTYRGETFSYHFLDYAVFISFFPQLVAGPIVYHSEVIPQLQDPHNSIPNYSNLSSGLYNFTLGLAKKVLLADVFGLAVDWGYSNIAALTSMDAFLVMLAYTFQIYFDFSGYSDMAVGLAKMFNIDIPHNFNSPYLAVSITDFWSRWHITLTRFLRKYVYFPLGGSRVGTFRKYLNIFIVFCLSGIWHGANWTFILWGMLHGIMNIFSRIFHKTFEKCHSVFRWFCTFLFVNVTWIFFRADSVSDAFTILRRMIGLESTEISSALKNCFVLPESVFLEKNIMIFDWISNISGYQMLFYFFIGFFIIFNVPNYLQRKTKFCLSNAVTTVLLLVWCLFSFSGVSQFLYFNF